MKKIVFSSTLLFIFLITISDSNASEAIPSLDAKGQDWVDETLNGMSLEEKVGQLIVGAAGTNFTNLDTDKFQQIKKEVTEYHVGGYHALGGEVFSAAFLIRRMQEMARIPLFVTADLEGGTGLIFSGAEPASPRLWLWAQLLIWITSVEWGRSRHWRLEAWALT
jgi:beta-N-acetylhexosaminidase